MLHTFEGWFCSTKLLDFPFFAIALHFFVPFNFGHFLLCADLQQFVIIQNTST